MTFKTNYQIILEFISKTEPTNYDKILLRSICFRLDQLQISLSSNEIIKLSYDYKNKPEYYNKTIKESIQLFLSKNKKE